MSMTTVVLIVVVVVIAGALFGTWKTLSNKGCGCGGKDCCSETKPCSIRKDGPKE